MSRRELALLLGDMSLDVLVGPYNWLGWIGMCRKVISRGFIFFFCRTHAYLKVVFGIITNDDNHVLLYQLYRRRVYCEQKQNKHTQ